MKYGRLEEDPLFTPGTRFYSRWWDQWEGGAAGSGQFRVNEWAGVEGGGIREVCPVTVGLGYCVLGGCLVSFWECVTGFQHLLSVRPSSLVMLNGCISISMASLMRRSMYLVLAERSLVSCSLMVWSWLKLCSATADLSGVLRSFSLLWCLFICVCMHLYVHAFYTWGIIWYKTMSWSIMICGMLCHIMYKKYKDLSKGHNCFHFHNAEDWNSMFFWNTCKFVPVFMV